MPPFNPAMIGAPSPVGRGGGGTDTALGAIGFFASSPGSKWARADGSFQALTSAQLDALPYEPQVQTMGQPTTPGEGNNRSTFGIAYGNGTYVATQSDGGSATDVSVSINGGGFFSYSTGQSLIQIAIRFVAGYFVIHTNGGLLISQNGMSWQLLSFPSGVSSFQAIESANGLIVLIDSGNPSRLWTWSQASGFVQRPSPSGMGSVKSISPYFPELGVSCVGFLGTSNGLDYAYTTKDFISFNLIGQLAAFPSALMNGLLAYFNGGTIQWHDPVTLVYQSQINAQVGQIYRLQVVNGILIVAGAQGLSEINRPDAVTKIHSSAMRDLDTSGKGYVGTSGSNYLFSAADRQPNGLWMPRVAGRRGKGRSFDAYMRIAA